MLKITETRVEYTGKPVGISKNPRFQWLLDSDVPDTRQTAYLLQISEDPSFSVVLAEQEEHSDSSAHVRVKGFVPRSLTKYFYRVKVWDNHDGESSWSEVSCFITAFTEASCWKAEFITAEVPEEPEKSRGTYVRKEFSTKKEVDHAFVCVTALGLYQLYINGKKVGQDEMTPGWTSYKKHLCYQMYDVTALLGEGGRHCIGAILGAGWYKGKMGFLEVRNNYGKCTALLCQLHVFYRDGSEEIICTDESWQGADSPILFAEIYDGEIYDATKEIKNWSRSGAEGVWHETKTVPFDKTVLISQFGCKPAEMTRVPAKRIITTPQGDTVIDFGQNMAGWIHVHLHGAAKGEKLELACFEELDAKGNVYVENLRGARQTMVYICGGEENEEYHPHFTFMGFRYAKVVSWPGTWSTEDAVAYALHSNMEQTGFFSCSNPDLNQLYSNILWGLKSNFLDIPTDCPQRNERVGWTGDAQIFCRSACYIMNTYLFFEKWLKDVALDQTPEGGVPHVVPDIISPFIVEADDWLLGQGTHSAAAWADVAVLNPWHVYLTFGDKQILTDQYESMRAWILFMKNNAKDGIWNYKLQFGDWVALDAEEGSYFGATPNDLTCTAYYAYSTRTFAKIAAILGKAEDAGYFGKLAEEIREVFIQHFFDKETGGMTVQTQTAHIIALYFDLTPREYREKTVQELMVLYEKENGHLVTGFVGTPYFTHALSQNGHLKEAYDLLLKDDFPSWLYQVKAGATTVWEHWDGKKPDGTMWSADMNSFNHYAYGAICEWMVRVIAGIEWDEKKPGYKQIHFYPRPGGNLTSASGRYMSVYGEVSCSWEREGEDGLLVSCRVPVNAAASLRLDHVQEILENRQGLPLQIQNGVLETAMGSGTYQLRIRIKL